jgi:hypothetical protein
MAATALSGLTSRAGDRNRLTFVEAWVERLPHHDTVRVTSLALLGIRELGVFRDPDFGDCRRIMGPVISRPSLSFPLSSQWQAGARVREIVASKLAFLGTSHDRTAEG